MVSKEAFIDTKSNPCSLPVNSISFSLWLTRRERKGAMPEAPRATVSAAPMTPSTMS